MSGLQRFGCLLLATAGLFIVGAIALAYIAIWSHGATQDNLVATAGVTAVVGLISALVGAACIDIGGM